MKLRWDLAGTTTAAVWYLVLVFVVPLISLLVMGLLYLWGHGGLLLVSAGWLAFSMMGYAIIHWQSRCAARDRESSIAAAEAEANTEAGPAADASLPEQLDTPAHWSAEDVKLWRGYCENINLLLANKPAWDDLLNLSLQLLANIANDYQAPNGIAPSEKNIYRFTLPEALQVLTVASARYRELLVTHVPFAERVNVSALLGLYKHKATVQTGWSWLNNTRRVWRLTNPLAAAVGEMRDQLSNRLFDAFSDHLQNDLKRLLLQEVVQAGVDLYSGRLKHTEEEMLVYQSRSQRQDLNQAVQAQEPMRVILVGQVSAGKSSLVNALITGIEAEVDHLPATDKLHTHVLTLRDSEQDTAPNDEQANQRVHLIDTPGLGTNEELVGHLVDSACDADLIVFVARANQPARSPDKQLMDLILERFEQQPLRRQPPMVLALTHVDQLSPRSEWMPPYDLNADTGKARSIAQALNSASEQIGLPSQSAAIPLCLSGDKGVYNVDALVAQLLMLREEAIYTQLNRRRVERRDEGLVWGEQWARLVRLGRAAGRTVVRR